MSVRPCAFHDPSRGCLSWLDEHNLHVAGAVVELFRERLTAGTPFNRRLDDATGINSTLYKATVLAALLHDLGKASMLYQERGSYRLHEHVSAMLIIEAGAHAGHSLDLAPATGGGGLLYLLAAAIAGRHHSAMRGRHPLDLYESLSGPQGSGSPLRILAAAIGSLDPGMARAAVARGLPGILGDAVTAAAERATGNLRAWSASYIGDRVGLYARLGGGDALQGRLLYPAVHAGTGALIVADILVAGLERRGDYPRGYIMYWMRELRAEQRLAGLLEEPPLDEVSSIVEEVLG